MKTKLLFLLATFALSANPFSDFKSEPKIAVQNTILAKVNGKTISMIDVKKKMDMIFHQSYPEYIDSPGHRMQFYEVSWKKVLMDMIDNELILADATDKEIKLTDGEVREVMEERFGPNVMQTLDKLELTYDETWKMVKNEMIVLRMNYWFIRSKAENNVTPQDVRQAYRNYISQNPPYAEWKYHVVSIRLKDGDDMLVQKVYKTLEESGKSPVELKESLKAFEAPGVSISVSNEFVAKTHDLSEIHKAQLESLETNRYSKPSYQLSRADSKNVYRIFYLTGKKDFPAPGFDVVSSQLWTNLLQDAVEKETRTYVSKLRKHYGFEENNTIPEDLHPFSIQ